MLKVMRLMLISFVVVLVVAVGSAFFIGKKIGHKEGLIGAMQAYSYLREVSVSPSPLPSPQPIKPAQLSERALKAAAWVENHTTDAQLKDAIKQNPNITDRPSLVRAMALIFDSEPEQMAMVETEMRKAGYIQ